MQCMALTWRRGACVNLFRALAGAIAGIVIAGVVVCVEAHGDLAAC